MREPKLTRETDMAKVTNRTIIAHIGPSHGAQINRANGPRTQQMVTPRPDRAQIFDRAAGAQVRRAGRLIVAGCTAAALSACVNLTAPDQPIVIELNINIQAEVLYRLADDANETIDEYAELF